MRGKIEKVVLLVDFSEPSLRSIEYGAALCLRAGAILHLLHICEFTPLVSKLREALDSKSADGKEAEKRHHRLAQLAKDYSSSELTITSEVRIGDPKVEIMAASAALNADLIVVSTHGRTALERALLGSVAEYVVHHSRCAVLVVRIGLAPAIPPSIKELATSILRKILLPTDLSPRSMQALKYASDFAYQFGAKITLVHFLPTFDEYGVSPLPAPENSLTAQNAKAQAERELTESLDALTHPEVIECRTVLPGPLFATLSDFVKENDFDLIICTTHGYSGFQHALRGSLAENLVRLVSCPVLLVRTPLGT